MVLAEFEGVGLFVIVKLILLSILRSLVQRDSWGRNQWAGHRLAESSRGSRLGCRLVGIPGVVKSFYLGNLS